MRAYISSEYGLITDNKMYICPWCGHYFESNINVYQCPECNYHYLICAYKENEQWINREEYNKIKQNRIDNKKIELQCTDCNKKAKFYGHVYGITCDCGGFYKHSGIDFASLLKKYRKECKLNQEQLAKKFKMSQELICRVESGERAVPENIQQFLIKYYKF